MSRLQLIEQKIAAMDGAGFQNLCDAYIARTEAERTSFNRTGSQLGKQKTVKGTPDTFFRLTDGKLSFVEFTTTDKGLVGKIKDDIDKCLDPQKTGIKVEELSSITICFNSRLSVEDETEIQKYAQENSISIRLIGIDWLALEIYTSHLILAKDILAIPLDTGQILPLDVFVQEYNHKGGQLSTPLDNLFLHRDAELEEIENKLAENDLLILTGVAGVGKTKIGLQTVEAFLAKNKSFSAFAVSKKDVDISDDLRIHLQQDKDFILLIDDANRQLLNLKQILGIFREKRKGRIKLVLTVRDYAVNDIINDCSDFAHSVVSLKKFSDEEITDILKSDSFEIRHSAYQKKIVELADGNARLAIMAARLAKEKNQEFLYGTVFELYDEYFRTFIKDFDTLGNNIVLKTLGLLSFFFSIHRDNKEFIEELLQRFGLDYYAFNDAINELEKRELIEVQYNVARVSEQVTATYFFYKVFIKDKLLSFETLLFNYFPQWKKRFSDTIIPANNTFGYESVLNEISDTLSAYLKSVKNDEEKALDFFSLFWFYKMEETLVHFHQKVFSLPEPIDPIYDTHYERNDHVRDDDQTLKHLAEFFAHNTESYVPALELAFEYCRRVPEKLPVLIRRIREKLHFDREDERIDYARQQKLFELIIAKAKEGQEIYRKAFFALAPSFLKHKYHVTKGGRGHTISWYDYPIPNSETIRTFRGNIWNALFAFFESYPDDVFQVFQALRPDHRGVNAELAEFDISNLIPFIEQHFDTDTFAHVHYAHELVTWLDREDLPNRDYRDLKKKFISEAYRMFCKLDWDRLRDKYEYEFEDFREYEKLKEEDVRQSFAFASSSDFPPFLDAITNAISTEKSNEWSVVRAVDIVVEETFLRNAELGLELFQALLANYPLGHYAVQRSMKAIIQYSDVYASRLWDLLQDWKHEQQIYWLLNFFDYLPDDLINAEYRDKFLSTVESIRVNATLNEFTIEKFSSIQQDIAIEVAAIIAEKIEKEGFRITFWHDFYEKFAYHFNDNLELLEKIYLQQEAIAVHHDFENNGLKKIVTMSPTFLLTYVKTFYGDGKPSSTKDTHTSLSFVWDVLDLKLIEEAINEIADSNYYIGIGDFPSIIFFNKLDENQSEKAKEFLSDYIAKYHTDAKRMDVTFDIIRHRLPDFTEKAFLHYLTIESNLEHFKDVDWIGNPGVVSGDVNWGELNTERWRKVADMLAKHPNQLALIPIKAYVKEQIDNEIRHAEHERQRKFIDPDY